jgi:hypothetical protein
MAGSWGCPHETDERCGKVNQLPCDPGMKGCVLQGCCVFANFQDAGKCAPHPESQPSLNTRPPFAPLSEGS